MWWEHNVAMSEAVIDLPGLRRSCGQCSLQQLCLAGGMGDEDLRRLDDISARVGP